MDILSDRGFVRLISIKLAHPQLIPAYVEQADLGLLEKSAETLSASEFADDVSRKYPLGDKASIWLAAAYHTKSATDLQQSAEMRDYVWERIKYAADVYGIGDDVEAIRAALSEQKQAAAEDIWAWERGADRKYPMHTQPLTKQAMDYFAKNRDCYPFAMRREIASNIYKRAQALKLEIPDVLRKEAGVGFPNRTLAAESVQDRAMRLKVASPALSQQLEKLAQTIKLATADELSTLVESAVEHLEALDKTAGFHYTGKSETGCLVERPCDLFFDVSPKTAEAHANRILRLDRHVFDCEKLASLLEQDVHAFDGPLGDDFMKRACEQLPQEKRASLDSMSPVALVKTVLSGLSYADKVELERHLQAL